MSAASAAAATRAPARPEGARPRTVPVQLGCCREPVRCALCNPPPRWPTPTLVRSLVDHYRTRGEPGQPLVVGFYGGAPPDAAALEAIDGLPFHARVRPDLLTRADVRRLADRGATRIELDLLTFHDPALRDVGRRHRAALVPQIVDGLREAGVAAGAVLAPGLPGTDHPMALADARAAAALFDTARILPVLVLDQSELREWHALARYRPLALGEAVTVAREMLEILEDGGCEVIRIGAQPGPDGMGRAVAGPRHPSLRELIEARRALEALEALLDGTRPGAHIVVRCSPLDQTRTRGPFNSNVRALRAGVGAQSLSVAPDPALERGEWRIDLLEGSTP